MSTWIDPKETQLISGAQSRDEGVLLRFGKGGLFNYRFDAVEALAAGDEASANGSETVQDVLLGRLDGRDRTIDRLRDRDEIFGGSLGRAVDIKMIADELEEGGALDEIAGGVDGEATPERLRLRDEADLLAGSGERSE
ncbi:MAG: hypothetical protein ABSH09_29320 [Bryobacteraceae bacterium]